MALKFYISVANGLEIKAREFWVQTPASGKVAGEKMHFLYPLLS